jgi:hypothetical protein
MSNPTRKVLQEQNAVLRLMLDEISGVLRETQEDGDQLRTSLTSIFRAAKVADVSQVVDFLSWYHHQNDVLELLFESARKLEKANKDRDFFRGEWEKLRIAPSLASFRGSRGET